MNEKTNESASHERMKPLVRPTSAIRTRSKIRVHTDAENDTRRSIPRMSFELKKRSRWNLDTSFSMIPISVRV